MSGGTSSLTSATPRGAAAAAPSPQTAEVRERVLEAAAAGTRLRLVGGGTWLDAGRPVRADATLALGAHAGIVDYTPGDLTLTALAGTPLGALEQATRAERQWLPLDPLGPAAGTLGATVATASAGPLAHAFGTPRDNVLGIEFVTGTGAVVRGGGRVVKNVAGFDLVRLLVGSWGTLGAVTEVTVRLRALPEADVTVALPLPAADAAARALVGRLVELHRTAIAPVSLELVSAPFATRLGLGAADRPLVLARLAGNAELVASQRATIASLGDVAEHAAEVWGELRRAADPSGAASVRFSHLPAHRFDTWRHALALAAQLRGAFVHATVGRGIARLVAPDPEPEALVAAIAPSGFSLGGAAGTLVFERLPAQLWSALSPSAFPGAGAGKLMRSVKARFDPGSLLNSGILGE